MSQAPVPDAARPRVGLLGGTFDPPHVGHLVVAECARVELGLDEVRFLVANDPWMKSTSAAPDHRLAMVRAAVVDDPHFVVDDRELRRGGPTYTADTLAQLATEEPGTRWVFLLGADAAAALDRWDRIGEAEQLAEFVCVARPGHQVPAREGLGRVDVPALDISSTDLRRRVADGRAVRHLTPLPVEAYIRQHALYAATSGPEP